jgi:hypothetical protein
MLDVSIDPNFLPEPVFVRDPLGDPLDPLDPEIPGRELFDEGTEPVLPQSAFRSNHQEFISLRNLRASDSKNRQLKPSPGFV